MTTIISRGKTLELNGNLLTGDTFELRDYIKKYLNGKWDGAEKGWRVDLDLVAKYIDQPGSLIHTAA